MPETIAVRSEDTAPMAVVTGAASGIGAAVARRLTRDGVRVIAVDLNHQGLDLVAAEGAEPLVADISTPTGRSRVVDAANGANYLVNAAGIIRVKHILEATSTDWSEIFAVNAEAVFFLCQAIGQRLRPGGAIVNLSSTSAKFAITTEAAIYAASKAAVISITRSFAYVLAPRAVRVNAVCPGIIETPMQDRVLEDAAAIRGTSVAALAAQRTRGVPLQRAASADECAGLIRFLLSDESAYMTGEAINFAGGLVMW
jgi:NAD(P)-dependent dehydrogenase (short-subunit alcohol dehydrogenase family)